MKCLEKKLDGNYARILCEFLNQSWKQYSTKEQLCTHLPPISQPSQVRQIKHAEHCWRSKDKTISNVILCTPTHRCASVSQPVKTYICQLWVDTGCSFEDHLGVEDDRDRWWGRVSRNPVLSVWLDDYEFYLITLHYYARILQCYPALFAGTLPSQQTGPGNTGPGNTVICREEENLIFCFGALFNSTLNFTQSGWHILFSPDLHFRLAKRVSGQNHSLRLETATRTDVSLVAPA